MIVSSLACVSTMIVSSLSLSLLVQAWLVLVQWLYQAWLVLVQWLYQVWASVSTSTSLACVSTEWSSNLTQGQSKTVCWTVGRQRVSFEVWKHISGFQSLASYYTDHDLVTELLVRSYTHTHTLDDYTTLCSLSTYAGNSRFHVHRKNVSDFRRYNTI